MADDVIVVPSIPSNPAPKPGYKTSEFWLVVLANILGMLAFSGIVPDESIWSKGLGLVISGLATIGYTYGRSLVKSQ